MSPLGLPPPQAEDCLNRPYASSQKGGTLIAVEVTDLESHQRRICSPDGYRPGACPKCECAVLHVHDYRSRVLLADPAARAVTVVRYLCVGCGATWRILPGFVARYLRRSWQVVAVAAMGAPSSVSQPPVPERTRRRWQARLRSGACLAVLCVLLGALAQLGRVLRRAGRQVTRQAVVQTYAAVMSLSVESSLVWLASLVHLDSKGVRVM
jgi:hypothetical protein